MQYVIFEGFEKSTFLYLIATNIYLTKWLVNLTELHLDTF